VKLLVEAPEQAEAVWLLADSQGRIWNRGKLQLQAGQNTVPLETGALPAGMYYLHLATDQFVEKLKLQKL
jgi:hypothetical protein